DAGLRLRVGETGGEVGLTALAERLQRGIDEADDAVDLGFLKAQSNADRARQVIMGADAANELMTSPILNSVVEAKSARVAQETLLEAFKSVPNIEAAPDVRGITAAAARSGAVGTLAAGGLTNPNLVIQPGNLGNLGSIDVRP